MGEMATIWSDLDKLLKKPKLKKPVNTYTCKECNGIKVYSKEGMPTCSDCGLVDSMYIDESPEWTSGVSDDGKMKDPSRCNGPNANPELFSQEWGKGTIISTQNTSTYENKRMAKINFHPLPDSVLKDAKMMYRKFNLAKLTRGAVRSGIKGNCVLYACRLSKIPRTTKEIADMFRINSKDISRTTQMFTETLLGKTEKNYVTRPFDVMQRLLNEFNVSREHRFNCNKMCSKLENCSELMSKTPNSVASTIIYYVLKNSFTKTEICEKCGISIPTLNKIENIIKKYLEE